MKKGEISLSSSVATPSSSFTEADGIACGNAEPEYMFGGAILVRFHGK